MDSFVISRVSCYEPQEDKSVGFLFFLILIGLFLYKLYSLQMRLNDMESKYNALSHVMEFSLEKESEEDEKKIKIEKMPHKTTTEIFKDLKEEKEDKEKDVKDDHEDKKRVKKGKKNNDLHEEDVL